MSFLKNLKPNKPEASLDGYFISMLAPSKFGKTTFAIDLADAFYGSLDSTLLLATEIGYKTMNGVFAIPITGFEYADDEEDEKQKGFIEVVDELVENKKDIPFKFIIIDTITALERYATSYIIKMANRQDNPETRYVDISDIPWGKGYNMLAEEIYNQIDRLKKAGFGVYVIGHSKTKKIKNKDGFEYDYTTFNVQTKTSDIIEREADMIIYGDLMVEEDDDGETKTNRKLRFRSDGSILCGTRFRKFPDSIDNDVHKFIEEFNKAVLNSYNNDKSAMNSAKKEQKASKKEEKDSDKLASREDLIKDITKMIKSLGKSERVILSKFILELNNGDNNYKSIEEVSKLAEIVEFGKTL